MNALFYERHLVPSLERAIRDLSEANGEQVNPDRRRELIDFFRSTIEECRGESGQPRL